MRLNTYRIYCIYLSVKICFKPSNFYIPVYVMVVKLPCLGEAKAEIECHLTQFQWKWLYLRFSIWEQLLWKTSLKADEDDSEKQLHRICQSAIFIRIMFSWPLTYYVHAFIHVFSQTHTQCCFPYSISPSFMKEKLTCFTP